MRARPSVRVGLAIGAVLITAGCSGSGSPSPPTSTSTQLSSATTTHAAPSTHRASPTPSGDPTTVAAPKVPRAQAAVDAYIGFLDAEIQVEQNPGIIGHAIMNRYLGRKAVTSVNAQLAVMATAGTAYRGIPDKPRIRVAKIFNPGFLRLTNCPLPASHNPYRQFNLTTGKDVVGPKRTPPPPYELTLTMFKTKTRWIMTKFSQDTSRTCTF